MEESRAIDVNGVIYWVSPRATVRAAAEAIRDFFGLQNGGLVVNGREHLLLEEVLGDLVGAISYVGGQPSVPTQPVAAPPAVGAAEGVFLHVYSCILMNGRHHKSFRASLFTIAEEHLAFTRHVGVDGVPDGISIDGFDIKVRLVFEKRSWMLRFQSALYQEVYMTGNKRPRSFQLTAEAKATDSDDEYDASHRVTVDAEELSHAFYSSVESPEMERVFCYQYRHEDNDSQPCNPDSDARSESIFSGEPGAVTIMEAETRAQMLEDHTHEFFVGKNPEVVHIKDKAKCTTAEQKNLNNRLYLSRYLHEAFNGINTEPKKFPWFALQFDRYDAVKVDCPKIGDDYVVAFSFKKRHRTFVRVHFYNEKSANIYSKYLKSGSRRIDQLTYELEMYFDDAEVAKQFIEWKESKTRARWCEAS